MFSSRVVSRIMTDLWSVLGVPDLFGVFGVDQKSSVMCLDMLLSVGV